ncbi:MAG: hypothetical protein HN842_00325 [Gammaproteobacteria bacterium]|jgi:hypothetical protein|nr:hypothetical protein [Gammaproteobacteria bacterium]MBT7306626.1 hypothetical protein [Gammaproteobacteria bacterium]
MRRSRECQRISLPERAAVVALLLSAPLWLNGCGQRATIPVVENSSHSEQRHTYALRRTHQPVTAVTLERPRPKHNVKSKTKTKAIAKSEKRAKALVTARSASSRRRVAVAPEFYPSPSTGSDPLLGLLNKIEQALQRGEYERAEGLLERALRIDSQRAGLWHDLAQVRYHQSSYREAVTLARRSNTLAVAGSVLSEENHSLIERARAAEDKQRRARY